MIFHLGQWIFLSLAGRTSGHEFLTERLRSIMFSQACVILSTIGGLPLPILHHWSHDQGFCLLRRVFPLSDICLGGGGGGLPSERGLHQGRPIHSQPAVVHVVLECILVHNYNYHNILIYYKYVLFV